MIAPAIRKARAAETPAKIAITGKRKRPEKAGPTKLTLWTVTANGPNASESSPRCAPTRPEAMGHSYHPARPETKLCGDVERGRLARPPPPLRRRRRQWDAW